mgnify:CR=1 FL=1
MASYNLFLLPGDGIGPEVMKEVEAIIAWFNQAGIAKFETDRGLVERDEHLADPRHLALRRQARYLQGMRLRRPPQQQQ